MSTPLSKPTTKILLSLSVTLLFLTLLSAQQTQPAPKATPPSYAAIPVDAARQANPVKSSPESLARAKKWWALDCAMCHGASGDGKGTLAADMKLKLVDFTDPNTLKDRTDGGDLLHHQERPSGYATGGRSHQAGRKLGPGELRPLPGQDKK